VLATLGVGYLIITALTYLAPFLDRVTGISGGAISAGLLAFGLATAAGAFASGRAADRSAGGTLIAANAGLARCSARSTLPVGCRRSPCSPLSAGASPGSGS
jgi:DHA1 family inner membrane transport protein